MGEGAAPLWESLLPFCDWIRARTEYLDSVLDTFLSAREGSAAEAPYQVVLMGAGYDTRSLRKQGPHVDFFEVDLPEIVEGKQRLYGKYVAEHPDRSKLPTMLGMDLDDARVEGTLLGKLYAAGLKRDVPTMFVFEAVLFYLEPEATEGIFGDIEAHSKGAARGDQIEAMGDNGSGVETVVAFTDSLKGLGISKPFMPDVRPVVRSVCTRQTRRTKQIDKERALRCEKKPQAAESSFPYGAWLRVPAKPLTTSASEYALSHSAPTTP